MATQTQYVFVLVGATGAVGREMLRILDERRFPISELRPVASEGRKGETVTFGEKKVAIRGLSPEVFDGADIAFFTAGGAISKEYAPIAASKGVMVVDNTSAFRMEPDVPLAVPEVNPEVLSTPPARRIVSVPNCSTVQIVVALAPLHRKARIRRIVVSTYQSTSGAGRRAMEELSKQVTSLYNFHEIDPKALPRQIAFNVIPQIDKFLDDGNTLEEQKIVQETKKIFGDPSIGISATAVRVPTFHSHAISVNLETERPLTAQEACDLLKDAPGVELAEEDPELYPTPIEAAGQDEVYVGRVRADPSRPNCLNLWVVADNLRKGAALNGIQILERLRANGLL